MHRGFIKQAISLAERGRYLCQRRPLAGCVVVAEQTVIAEGYADAQRSALSAALAQCRGEMAGSTVYLTIAPAPEEAQVLIDLGVRGVVIAEDDPAYKGVSVAQLRTAGLLVAEGVDAEAAARCNRGYHRRWTHKRPWVRALWAMSVDGRGAASSGERLRACGAAAWVDIQHWRASSAALISGVGHLLSSNAPLTLDLALLPANSTPPTRVICDAHLDLPLDAAALSGPAPTLIFSAASKAPEALLSRAEVMCDWPAEGRRLDLQALLGELARRGMNEVQLESGAKLGGAFLSAGLVDELLIYVVPSLLGGGLPALARHSVDRKLSLVECRALGDDVCLHYQYQHPQPLSAD